MRNTRFVLIGAAGLIVAACSGKSKTMSDDLKKDLDMASTSDGLALASGSAKGSQVVSAIEQATPPAPRQIAASQRVVKHKPAPTQTPAPVETQRQADVSPTVAVQPADVQPAPTEITPVESPRPHPIAMPSGSGTSVGRGGGSVLGGILGGISVVLRGGGVDGDQCDPRPGGRGQIPVSINSRIPVINGTFPGAGRVGRGR